MAVGVARRVSGLAARLRSKVADQKAWVSRQAGLRRGGFLFLPINGSGLGHLTRCLAIAEAVRLKSPDTPIAFFTTSLAIPIVSRFGYTCFHWPPKQTVGRDMTAAEWNEGLESQLLTVVGQLSPETLVYDGGAPYPGVRRVLEHNCVSSSVWIKRGLSSQKLTGEDLSLFDAVISPGEIDQKCQVVAPNEQAVDPIILTPRTIPSRVELSEWYGLDIDKKWVFVQLGAGNINDVASLEEVVCKALSLVEDVEIILAENPISNTFHSSPRGCRKVSAYPASALFPHLQLAVLAAGYNSVHEAVLYGVNTLLVPNEFTRSDDQCARAQRAALCSENITVLTERTLQSDAIGHLTNALRSKSNSENPPLFCNGASQVASVLLNLQDVVIT